MADLFVLFLKHQRHADRNQKKYFIDKVVFIPKAFNLEATRISAYACTEYLMFLLSLAIRLNRWKDGSLD